MHERLGSSPGRILPRISEVKTIFGMEMTPGQAFHVLLHNGRARVKSGTILQKPMPAAMAYAWTLHSMPSGATGSYISSLICRFLFLILDAAIVGQAHHYGRIIPRIPNTITTPASTKSRTNSRIIIWVLVIFLLSLFVSLPHVPIDIMASKMGLSSVYESVLGPDI